jgi:hypothetical protein
MKRQRAEGSRRAVEEKTNIDDGITNTVRHIKWGANVVLAVDELLLIVAW